MRWNNKVDISFLIFTITAFILLILAQAGYYFDVDNGLTAKRAEEYYTAELPAVREEYAIFGNLELRSKEGVSLAKAVVLINGQQSGDFKDGDVLIRVYEGDTVTIDTTAYDRELEFYIGNYSKNIDIDKLNQVLVSYRGRIDVGTVSFK